MCEADDSCISYTVARPVVLPAHEYYWGEKANCCLERREYPPGAFVNPNPNKGGQVFNNCQRDAMCWTRYEKDKDKGKGSTKEPCFNTPKTPSELCTAVFGAVTYTQDKIDEKIDFIANGCEYNDTTYESMLAEAAAQCEAEIYAESTAVHIVSNKSAIYLHARINLPWHESGAEK